MRDKIIQIYFICPGLLVRGALIGGDLGSKNIGNSAFHF